MNTNQPENNVRFIDFKSEKEAKDKAALRDRLRQMERSIIMEAMRRGEAEELEKVADAESRRQAMLSVIDMKDEINAPIRLISVDEATELQPTSPYAFRMKICTMAVHQALQFYSAWNWMKANEVANA